MTRPVSLALLLVSIVASLLLQRAVVHAQTPPGPSGYTTTPLVSQCDIMRQIAQTASQALNNTVLCTSSALPPCDTISCNVLANGDRLQFQVLQCSQSIRITNRASDGTALFDHTFATSGSAQASIGGGLQLFNVTLDKYSGLALGIEVNVSVDMDTGPVDVTFVPYQLVPINTTCGSAQLSPTCQVTRNIAQYTMVTFHIPRVVAFNCTVSRSCFDIICGQSNSIDSIPLGNYVSGESFLPCSSPPSFRAVSYDGRNGSIYSVFTFDRSGIVQVSNITEYYFNVTIDHINANLMGLGFRIITADVDQVYIPYVRVPLGRPQSCRPTPSLVTLCDITAQAAMDASAVLSGTQVSCVPSQCNVISCTVLSTNDLLQFQILSNTTPPSMRVINHAVDGSLLFQHDFDHSEVFTGEIGGSQTPLNVTVGQYPGLALALEVVALVQSDTFSENITFVHYTAFPLNSSLLPARSPMCHAMDEIARFVMANISSNSSSATVANTPNCTVGPEPCNTSMCTFRDSTVQTLSIYQCSSPPLVQVTDSALGLNVTTAFTVHDSDVGVSVIVEDRGGNLIGLEVDVGGVPYFPYIVIPLNTMGCPRPATTSTTRPSPTRVPPTRSSQPTHTPSTSSSSQRSRSSHNTVRPTRSTTTTSASSTSSATTTSSTATSGSGSTSSRSATATATQPATVSSSSTSVTASVSPTKSPGVTNLPTGGGSKVALGVGVSVSVVVVLCVLGAALGTLFYCKWRNRTRDYQFHPMSFSDVVKGDD